MRLIEQLKQGRRYLGVGVTALILSAGLPNSSEAYLFDADGSGIATAQNIVNLDWAPTSFLALNGVTAISNFGAPGGCAVSSCSFDVVTQGKLTAANDAANTNLLPASFGAGGTNEITFIARFSETVTAVTGGNHAEFSVNTAAPMYIEIYFDTTRDSNPLTGAGFGDGHLILKGTLLQSSTGDFTVNLATPLGALDQSVSNDYANQNTVSGQGTQGVLNIGGFSNQVDSAFFTQALASFGLSFANTSISLPFTSVDPSDCFTAYAVGTGSGATVTGADAVGQCANFHINGLMSANPDATGTVPNIGVTNGLFSPGVTDFMAQTDPNSALVAAPTVPEPASFLLLGAGLLGMGRFVRRNRKSEK